MKNKKCFSIICANCLLILLLALTNTGFVSFAAEEEKPVTFNSVVEIESYEIEGGYIEAGKINNIKLTLVNANTYTAANNLVIIVNSNSGMIYPTYGNDNQYYIGKLEAGKKTELEVPMIANSNLTGDYIDLSCNMIYESAGNRINNTSTMVLPTQNISNIVVSSIDVSAHGTLNGKSLLSISYANNSAGNINDAVLRVDGNVSDTTKDIELGTIIAGKSYTKDCNVIFTESGAQTISIKLIYTDINGQSIESDLGTFNVTVGEESGSVLDSKADDPLLIWGGRAIAFVALIAAAVVTFIYIKKR